MNSKKLSSLKYSFPCPNSLMFWKSLKFKYYRNFVSRDLIFVSMNFRKSKRGELSGETWAEPKVRTYNEETMSIDSIKKDHHIVNERTFNNTNSGPNLVVRVFKVSFRMNVSKLFHSGNFGESEICVFKDYRLLDSPNPNRFLQNLGRLDLGPGDYFSFNRSLFLQFVQNAGNISEDLLIEYWNERIVYLLHPEACKKVCLSLSKGIGPEKVVELSRHSESRILDRWKAKYRNDITNQHSIESVWENKIGWPQVKALDPKLHQLSDEEDDDKLYRNLLMRTLRGEEGEIYRGVRAFLSKNPLVELEVVIGIKNSGNFMVYASTVYRVKGIPKNPKEFKKFQDLEKVSVSSTLRSSDLRLFVMSPHEVLIFKVKGAIPYKSVMFMCSSPMFNFCSRKSYNENGSKIDEKTRKNSFAGGEVKWIVPKKITMKDEDSVNEDDLGGDENDLETLVGYPSLKTVYIQKSVKVSLKEHLFSNERIENLINEIANYESDVQSFKNRGFSNFYSGDDFVNLGSVDWKDGEVVIRAKIIVCGDWYSRTDFGFYLRSVRLALVSDGKVMDDWLVSFVSRKEFDLEEGKRLLQGVVRYMEKVSVLEFEEEGRKIFGMDDMKVIFKNDGVLLKQDLKELWEVMYMRRGFERLFSPSSQTPMILKYLYNFKSNPRTTGNVRDLHLSPDKYFPTFILSYFIYKNKWPGYETKIPDFFGKREPNWNLHKNLYPFLPLVSYLMETFHPSLMYARFLLPILWNWVISLIIFYAFASIQDRSDQREYFFELCKKRNIFKESWKIIDLFQQVDLDLRNELTGGQFLALLDFLCEENCPVWTRLDELVKKIRDADHPIYDTVKEFLEEVKSFAVELKEIVEKESGKVDVDNLFNFVKTEDSVHSFIDPVAGVLLKTAYLYSVVKKDVLLKQLLSFAGRLHCLYMRVQEYMNHLHYSIADRQRPPPRTPSEENSSVVNIDDGKMVKLDGQGESMRKMTFVYLKILLNEEDPFLEIDEDSKEEIKRTLRSNESQQQTHQPQQQQQEEEEESRSDYLKRKKEYVKQKIQQLEDSQFDFYEHVPLGDYKKYIQPVMTRRKKIFDLVKKLHDLSKDFQDSNNLDDFTWKEEFVLDFFSGFLNGKMNEIPKEHQIDCLKFILKDIKGNLSSILGEKTQKRMKDEDDDEEESDSDWGDCRVVNCDSRKGILTLLDCGMGKTLIYLLLLAILHTNNIFTHTVIVTNAGLMRQLTKDRDTWERKFRGRFPKFHFLRGEQSRGKKKENVVNWALESGVLVISYESIGKLFAQNCDYPDIRKIFARTIRKEISLLIADEAQKVGSDSELSNSLISCSELFNYIMEFSGDISDGKTDSYLKNLRLLSVEVNLENHNSLHHGTIAESLFHETRSFTFRKEADFPFSIDEFMIFVKKPIVTKESLKAFGLVDWYENSDGSSVISDFKFSNRIRSMLVSPLIFYNNSNHKDVIRKTGREKKIEIPVLSNMMKKKKSLDEMIRKRKNEKKSDDNNNNIHEIEESESESEESEEEVEGEDDIMEDEDEEKSKKKRRKKKMLDEEEEEENDMKDEEEEKSKKKRRKRKRKRKRKKKMSDEGEDEERENSETHQQQKKSKKKSFKQIIKKFKIMLLFLPKLDVFFKFAKELKENRLKGLLYLQAGDVKSFQIVLKEFSVAIDAMYEIGIGDFSFVTSDLGHGTRTNNIASFKVSKSKWCLVSTCKVLGTGTDLPFVSDVLLGDVDVNPNVTNQSKKRVVRLSQISNSVRVYHLVTADGFDMTVIQRFLKFENKLFNGSVLNYGKKLDVEGIWEEIKNNIKDCSVCTNRFIKSFEGSSYEVGFVNYGEVVKRNETKL